MNANHLCLLDDMQIPGYPVGQSIRQNKERGIVYTRALVNQYGLESIRLICMGSSGAILSTLIASNSDINIVEIVCIKKEGEQNHRTDTHITFHSPIINVIVDDFMSTGKTLYNIYQRFTTYNPEQKIDCIIIGGHVWKTQHTISIKTELLICKTFDSTRCVEELEIPF